MTAVITWHNVTRDESGRHLGMVHGYRPGHLLVPVDKFDVDSPSENLLDDLFRLFNVGDDPDFGPPDEHALAYRQRGNRSLSVGDVIQVNDHWWSCESHGWNHIETPDSEQLDGHAIDGSSRIDL
jgi:hypothetical protein